MTEIYFYTEMRVWWFILENTLENKRKWFSQNRQQVWLSN